MSDTQPTGEMAADEGSELPAGAVDAVDVPQQAEGDAGVDDGAPAQVADAAEAASEEDEALDPLAELTIHTAALRREALMSIAAATDEPVVGLDLSHTLEFDSAGVQLLMALRRTLAANGRQLRIEQASTAVTSVLDTYHLDAHSLAPCQAH